MTDLEVVSTGPLATVQDLGRPGYAELGVPRSGAADRDSMRLANRLVGNPETAAVIEATMGGLALRAQRPVVVAVTGALTTVRVDQVAVGLGATVLVAPGAVLSISAPTQGCRSYLAVRGGINIAPVLGSRATDTLSGIGPAPLRAGDLLPVGSGVGAWPAVTQAPINTEPAGELDAQLGPRSNKVIRPTDLAIGAWEVSADSDRIGVRLTRSAGDDAPLLEHHVDAGEPASEGVAHGAVQIPPSGKPVLFLADHPVTGGYPVVAVLRAASISRAAQLVAGERIRFRLR